MGKSTGLYRKVPEDELQRWHENESGRFTEMLEYDLALALDELRDRLKKCYIARLGVVCHTHQWIKKHFYLSIHDIEVMTFIVNSDKPSFFFAVLTAFINKKKSS